MLTTIVPWTEGSSTRSSVTSWRTVSYLSIASCECGSFDSSVGRAVDCRGVIVIHRSLVRIRLEGLIFSPNTLFRSTLVLYLHVQHCTLHSICKLPFVLYLTLQYYYFFFLIAYNVPDLEKKPTATVIRPLRGHLSTVARLLLTIGDNFWGGINFSDNSLRINCHGWKLS